MLFIFHLTALNTPCTSWATAVSMHQQAPLSCVQDQRQQFGRIQSRKAASRIHFCISCNFPVEVYGRTLPCLHTYCLTCASDLDKCAL